MNEKFLTYDQIKIGDVVSIIDTCHDRIAVGIVREKRETRWCKKVGIQLGFDEKNLEYYIVERDFEKNNDKEEILNFVYKIYGNVIAQ